MNPQLVDAIGGSSLFLVSLSMLPGSLISTPHLRGEGWLILIIVLTRGFSLAHWFSPLLKHQYFPSYSHVER